LTDDEYRRKMIGDVLNQDSMSSYLELLIKEFDRNRRADGWKEDVKIEEGMMEISEYVEKYREGERLELGNRTTGL
jgi:hypothetical protein